MTSPTDKHWKRHFAKVAAAGRRRKNALRRDGSTARDLSLDRPNANELEQNKKRKTCGACAQ